MIREALAAGAASATLLLAPLAVAQDSDGGFALDHFEPTPAGDVFFGVPSPYASGHIAPRGYLLFDYAHKPIRIQGQDVAVVGAQGMLAADFSMAFWDRLLLSVHMPLAVLQSGDDPGQPGVVFTPLEVPRAGDLRIGARGRIWGDEAGPFQLGVEGFLLAPTGDRAQYDGEGKVRGIFDVSLGGRVGSEDIAFVWTASGGVEVRGSDRSHAGRYGVGIGLLALHNALQLDAELLGVSAFDASKGAPLSTVPLTVAESTSTNLEVLFGAKGRVLDGLTFGAAAGPGLLSAIGTPEFRVLGMIGWAPLAEPTKEEAPVAEVKDRDDDGIADATDACPDERGQPNTDPMLDGCPPRDRDNDGVFDVEDACPAVAGERNVDATRNGCPLDADSDGVPDGVDACATTPGEPDSDPAKNGCPRDQDGDGIMDRSDACKTLAGPPNPNPKWNGCPEDGDGDGITLAFDACPDEKGVPDPDPKLNGCSKLISVTDGEIIIRQQVQFVTYGSTLQDTVSPDSEALLTEVRDAIQAHPEIELIEVQGHTDDSGSEEFNMALSEQRANVVRDWLAAKGIASDRLVAKGYGFSRPIADNRIRTGRQANRRVQFVILRRR